MTAPDATTTDEPVSIPSSTVASTEAIRTAFPALEREENGLPVAYFDGPGGTQAPRAVGESILDYLYHHNANTHWAYMTSAETDAALAHAREVMAAWFHGRSQEVVFGHNMTTLTFHLSRALAPRFGSEDAIVVTELDHHANVGPWTILERERGVEIRWARMRTATGTLDMEHLESCIGKRTRLVAVGAASNSLGTINDIGKVVELARAAGALVFVDAVHLAPHGLPDVDALGCDFLACSPYKFYGPHLGVLWTREDLLRELPFAKLIPASDEPPERAETGTLNHEGIVGAAAAVEWLASLAGAEGDLRSRLAATYGALHERGDELFARLWDGLRSISGVTLYGPPPSAPRTPTVAFTVEGVPSSEVTRRLSDRAVFTSHGDFYATTVVERLGLQPEGLVRAGCTCYTTAEEIDRLVAGVEAIAG